jgi:NADH-quinone oxidoreductase subunit L
MSNSAAAVFVILVLGFPLLGSALNALAGPKLGRTFVNITGPGVVLGAFVIALLCLVGTMSNDGEPTYVTLWNWLDLSGGAGGATTELHVGMSFTIDPLSVIMMLVITGVGFLIHLYAVGYMEHDETPHRFFSYMNFFIFSMLTLVLADDLVVLIIGWALVALASYLLIAYYYDRPSAVAAGRKAFVTQVIGDLALVIAAFMIFTGVHTLNMHNAFGQAGTFSTAYLTGICVLLAIGAFAKSAQFPLHTWLPDAMEGPTPVSALIHAATMVTAGVYLIARFHPFFDRAPVAQMIVASVGMGTALMAGIIAISQIDIKRVIAYSTMSQIGLMIYAVGIGAYTAGMFHFVTHAIFKALLFMAAGNVIHALHDEQDIRLMGGLGARMKRTQLAFLLGSFALGGFPLFAGWNSKEDLLGFGFAAGGLPLGLYVIGLAVNVLTGIYTFRLFITVFRGEPQTARVFAAKEAPMVMLAPVMLLGGLSLVAGWFLAWPFPTFVKTLANFLDPVFVLNGAHVLAEPSMGPALIALILGTICSVAGIGMARFMWETKTPDPAVVSSRLPRFLPLLSYHRFYFDEIYDALFVKPIRAISRAVKRVVEPEIMDGWIRGTMSMVSDFGVMVRNTQTGLVRDYASYMIGMVAVIAVVAAVWAR